MGQVPLSKLWSEPVDPWRRASDGIWTGVDVDMVVPETFHLEESQPQSVVLDEPDWLHPNDTLLSEFAYYAYLGSAGPLAYEEMYNPDNLYADELVMAAEKGWADLWYC